MKERKKNLSPEEWAKIKDEFKQAKEHHRQIKDHMRGVHKMMKKEHKHALRAAMFSSYDAQGPHGHHDPHAFGHHDPNSFGHHAFGPHFQAADATTAPGVEGTVPPEFTGFPHQPGFVPPFGFPHYPHPHPFFGDHHGDHSEKLVARHVKDVTIEDGTRVPAGTQFVKTWRVRNEGQPWPAGCRLTYNSCEKHNSGDSMSGPEHVTVEAPVAANAEVDISVPLVAPTRPGRYTGYWKMRTPDGRKFGQRLWVTIVVPGAAGSSSSSDEDLEADRYEALVDSVLAMGFTVKRHRVFRLLQKHEGNVDKVALKLAEKQQKFDRKAAEKAAQQAARMTL